MSKKQTSPNNPDQLPELPTSPFQHLGCLRVLRGCILLVLVKNRGVEVTLSTGLSLTIPYREIQKLGFRNNRQFADALAMGADFPSLWFAIHCLTTPRPIWADSWGDGSGSTPAPTPAPRRAPAPHPEPVEAEPQEEPQPPAQSQGQTLLPLPPSMHHLPGSRGGGIGGR